MERTDDAGAEHPTFSLFISDVTHVATTSLTVISFRVDIDDAEVLERVLNLQYLADEFTGLDEGEMLVKTTRTGKSEIFRATALPPTEYTHRRRENLLDVSRRKYGRPREAVEWQIRRQIVS